MCDRRTSSRAKKQVDYSAVGGKNFNDDEDDDDDDEDFAISRGPPAKKLRTAKEKQMEKVKLKNPEQTSSSKSNKTSKERRSLDDRLFERDMELAVSFSKTSSSDPKGSHIKPISGSSKVFDAPDYADAESSQPTGSAAVKETKSVQPESTSATEMQHEAENEMACVQKEDSQLGDDDDAVLEDSLSLSEDEKDGSDSNSSFDSRPGRQKKKQAENKKKANAKPSAKPAKPAKPTVEKLKNSKTITTVNPASSSKMICRSNPHKVASAGHEKVISSDKQPAYSSPTSGVLRIGLSRNVKVKPLHQLHSPV